MSGWKELAGAGWLRRVVAAVMLFLFASTLCAAETLKGVALVIGQSKYEHLPALTNPANDARAMVKLLSDLGFDARSVSDRDAPKLKRDLERFVEDAEGADVAFLYYSGHGIESAGENWLIPVDADVPSLDDAQKTLVALSSVMDELKGVVPLTVVLLDACRTNPFPADALVRKAADDPGTPVGAGGLTATRGAVALTADQSADNLGTVIGFAAEPGRAALDGTGENSPYATALLRHLGAMDGVEFGQVMRMVTEEVYLDTKAKQRPWVNESLRRLLYFGVPQPAPTGDDGLITGERRQLLLTISDLPDFSRRQVENAAAKDGVPLDALYGVLRALGTEKTPEDPEEMANLLNAQAERLKAMIAQREALRTDDPEIKRLTEAADHAIQQGAVVTARKFLDDAVKRVEATDAAVDAAEEAVKNKRLAAAAIYAQRAAASELAFDYLAAAADYRKAFELVERWDADLSLDYKNLEATALLAHGEATGDPATLGQALEASRALLSFVPYGEQNRRWALIRANTASVLQAIGELSNDSTPLDEAAAMFRESLSVLGKDDPEWAAVQHNFATVLRTLSQRRDDPKLAEEVAGVFQAVLERQDRSKAPLEWANTQSALAAAFSDLFDRTGSTDYLVKAEAAYGLASEEFKRETSPLEWALVTNNIGLTLDRLGSARNDPALLKEATEKFTAALEVRTRDRLPLQWATTRLNLAGTLTTWGKLEMDTDRLNGAEVAFRDALTVLTRETAPVLWATAQANLGNVLQLLGQQTRDPTKLDASIAAFRSALEENTIERAPLDHASATFGLAGSLMFLGQINQDPTPLKQAIVEYGNVLKVYTREKSPRQWAMTQANLGTALHSLASHEDMIQGLRKSVAARRLALEILTRENAAADWASIQNGLGTCLLNLATFDKKAELLPEALDAFEASEQVFTREAMTLQWAFAENNIGDVHWGFATQGGRGRPEFEKAIQRFENAKQAFIEAGYVTMAPLIDNKINLIREAMAKL